MSLRRSGERVRPNIELDTQVSASQSQPSSSRSVHFPDSKPSPSGKQRRPTTRIIRTFEEIERIVPQEQWYEELECGICAHVLGSPQSLVPCGHSFCGPCAWTWIKINNNHTCPHCRVPVNDLIPLVPNITVDQIIERKLDSLPDGKEKTEMRSERQTKTAEWKVLGGSFIPAKSAPKRTRGPFESLVSGMFDNGSSGGAGHQRRASRHLAELGPPVSRSAYVGMNLSEVARLDTAEQARNEPQASAQRRVRDSILSGQARTSRNIGLAADPQARPVTPPRHRIDSGGSQVDFSPGRVVFEDRSGITRSSAFTSRQRRGRDGVSRERALVVDSDNESESDN